MLVKVGTRVDFSFNVKPDAPGIFGPLRGSRMISAWALLVIGRVELHEIKQLLQRWQQEGLKCRALLS